MVYNGNARVLVKNLFGTGIIFVLICDRSTQMPEAMSDHLWVLKRNEIIY